MYVHGIKRLFPFEKYSVRKINVAEDVVQVKMRRDRRYNLWCPSCGCSMGKNDMNWQTAKDLPLGTAKTVVLTYEAIQGKCGQCGKFTTFHPEGIDPHAKATWRHMVWTSQLCRFMPLSRVEQFATVSTSTAYRWDKKVLQEELPEPDLDDLKVLMVDEKAIWKHYGFVTIVLNGETGELLHLAKGKKKEALTSFFDKCDEQQKQSIRAVAMDRAGAYKSAVQQEIPHAEIVYDKFHIIKNYLSQVVDAVRRKASRGAVGKMKEIIKGQRYNLFRNPENLTEQQQMDLEQLLQAYEDLNCVHVLKEELRRLWDYIYGAWARKHFNQWIEWAREASEIAPLQRFAHSLERSKEQILNFFNHRITNGLIEGFNNLISRINHRACGHSDLEYFWLKLRQESLASDP